MKILTQEQREEEKQKLFDAATLHSKFTENDLCVYSMYNNHEYELHQELIEELIEEGKLIKLQYDPKEDSLYKFGEYANPEYITAYQRNLFYGEEPMTDEEVIDMLLEIEDVSEKHEKQKKIIIEKENFIVFTDNSSRKDIIKYYEVSKDKNGTILIYLRLENKGLDLDIHPQVRSSKNEEYKNYLMCFCSSLEENENDVASFDINIPFNLYNKYIGMTNFHYKKNKDEYYIIIYPQEFDYDNKEVLKSFYYPHNS